MFKKNWKWYWFIGVMIIFFTLAGCAGVTPKGATYSLLKSTADAANATAPTVFELHKKGILNDAQVNKYLDLSDKLLASYNVAQAMFEAYVAVQSVPNTDKLTLAVQQLVTDYKIFYDFYNQILKGGN